MRAADLMKFACALMSNKLLKSETLAEAIRPQFTTGDNGFGFQVGRPDEARTYGHGGGAPGMNAILRVYPESGQSVIVLCNLGSPSASRMGDWLHARMPLLSNAGHRRARNPTGGPCCLKIETAGDTVEVEEFSCKVELRAFQAFHGSEVYLFQTHTAAGDELLFIEAFAAYRELTPDQLLDE